MRKMLIATCVAVGFMLCLAEISMAQGRNSRGGRSSWNNRPPVRVYNYAPYGRYYQAPVVRSYSRGYYPAYGRSSFYGYGSAFGPNYNNFYRSGFGGGYGNLGYPSPYGLRGGSGIQLRIGF